ncbi:hypothetical protein H0I76_18550 [Limibaculum sp. M0105]|uniref:Uncharacterized protein n=1 Tax=Thermohalobaculum xanthum TaxID=2753746 RepID=A0A8J7MA67_9RHOB|nr:hypothetical protein [Thermohalobaculum xanthum]MBK0401204.1 hypothetical protein [Thermohalobaculum xanthum]
MSEIDSPKPAIGYLLQTRGRRHQNVAPHERREVQAQMDVLRLAKDRLNLMYKSIELDFAPRRLVRIDQLPELVKLIESHGHRDPQIVIADAFDLIARFSMKEWPQLVSVIARTVVDGRSGKALKTMEPQRIFDTAKAAQDRLLLSRARALRSAKTRKLRCTTNVASPGTRKAALRGKKRLALRRAEPIYQLYKKLCAEAGSDHVPYPRVAERANELGLKTSRGNPYDAAKARDAVLRCKLQEHKKTEHEKS